MTTGDLAEPMLVDSSLLRTMQSVTVTAPEGANMDAVVEVPVGESSWNSSACPLIRSDRGRRS